MADQDFLSYSSIYGTFSKGPKSIYYGIGDEMLPGAILNIPQTDEDDEWGRTQRIADESAYDFIARIYKTLFDPYNAITDVSLVPGEAGSEINVAKNMIKLVGRSGIDTGVFSLTNQTMTLGTDDTTVFIDGPGKSITIGNGFAATDTQLSLNGKLTVNGKESDTSASIGYIGSSLRVSTVYFDDNGINPYFRISVNGANYTFKSDKLDIAVGLSVAQNVDISGSLAVTQDVEISGDLNVDQIISTDLTATNIHGNSIYTTYLYPETSGTDLRIGRISPVSDTINIYSKVFNIYTYAYDPAMPSVSIAKDLSDIWNIDLGAKDCTHTTSINGKFNVYSSRDPETQSFSVGSFIYANIDIIPGISAGVFLGNSIAPFNGLWAKSGNFTGTLYTRDILPEEYSPNDTPPPPSVVYNIGSDLLRYGRVYTEAVNVNMGLHSDNTGFWYICGPELRVVASTIPVATFTGTSVNIYSTLRTQNIYPEYSSGVYLGSVCGGYEALFLRDHTSGIPKMVYVNAGSLVVS
jgi:hypothetical protein